MAMLVPRRRFAVDEYEQMAVKIYRAVIPRGEVRFAGAQRQEQDGKVSAFVSLRSS
ncbi:MAG: hypothetical protein LC748_07340 [Thermomicrobia bacterium]|nr:hypothetical protein [Thermomicrobia bacterium]